jgi:hypothetical protein
MSCAVPREIGEALGMPGAEGKNMKGHAEALDRNWAAHHNGCMDAIRSALGLPNASVPEMCERIRTLRQTELGAQELLKGRVGISSQAEPWSRLSGMAEPSGGDAA